MKNYISPRTMHLVLGLCIALSFWILLMGIATMLMPDTFLYRIVQILGGTKDGYIQMLTYVAFVIGILELLQKEKDLRVQSESFGWQLLPTEGNQAINRDELALINHRVVQLETYGQTSLLAILVKRTCSLFASNNSVNDAMQVVETKVNTAKEESEGQLEIVRYLINTISALGFIGTVIGLSVAIGNSSMANTEGGMKIITQYLYLAFDTTLVALLLGLVLNYRYHAYLERMDTFYAKSKSYVVDNLICRVSPV